MISSDRESLSRKLYFVGLSLLAISLPLSMFMMSVSQFVLGAAWLINGNYYEKLRMFWRNKSAVVFSLIFLLCVIGMLYTDDAAYGLHHLKISLPLIVLPFIMAGMGSIPDRKSNIILWLFIAGVTVGAIINGLIMMGLFQSPEDYRGSLFISHIRFSLMICMAIFTLLYFMIRQQTPPLLRFLMILLIIWLVVFLFILKSVTGILIFIICAIISMIYFALDTQRVWLRKALILLAILITAIPMFYIYSSIRNFYDIKDDTSTIDTYSPGGEKYYHNLDDQQLEHGHYTWRYIAWKELEESWNARSSVTFSGDDKSGQPLYSTLVRFLTSKGLKKDAEGVKQLSQEEVEAIENGVANIRLMDGLSLDDRIYEIIWESHNYFHGVNPQGHSVSQRLEFWKTGLAIFKSHPVIGVGTGGARKAFKEEYERTQSRLSEGYRLRAHNQYLTIMVSFGTVGLIVFIIALLFPFFKEHKCKEFLYIIFIVIVLLSMANEDTLETQAGVTFVAFLNSLFLFAKEKTR